MEKQYKEKIGFDSRKKSILETVTDVVLGFVIFLPVNYFVLPLFVDQIADYSIIGMLTISAIFTSISLVRKYTIRRWFENHRKIVYENKIWATNNLDSKQYINNFLKKILRVEK